MLALKVVVLDAELNSASNDGISNVSRCKNKVIWAKILLLTEILDFLSYFTTVSCRYSLIDLCWL